MRAFSLGCSIALALLAPVGPGGEAMAQSIPITIHADAASLSDPSVARAGGDPHAALAAEARLGWPAPDVLSPPAALAAAKTLGLAEGKAPWRASLAFDAVYGTIVWRVHNTTTDTIGRRAGRVVVIDARSGRQIRADDWTLRVE